jgi:hypothetical protein
MDKYKKHCLVWGGVLLASAQFILLLVFSLKIIGEKANQFVGISLGCFFIVWSVMLGMKVFNKYFEDESSSEEPDQQNE